MSTWVKALDLSAVSDTDSVCATVPARLWACDCMVQGSAYPFRRLLAPLLWCIAVARTYSNIPSSLQLSGEVKIYVHVVNQGERKIL